MMKNFLLTVSLLFVSLISFGQLRTLNYQAVILDPKPIEIPGTNITGQPLKNGKVSVRFALISSSGSVDYEENHETTTDEFGLINLTIGSGLVNASGIASNSNSITYRTFDSIKWDSNVKQLKVSLSFDSGKKYTNVSLQPFNYTAYAFYAESVEYKNVRDSPTTLSFFNNDVGFIVSKDLDPLKNQMDQNQKDNMSKFLIINQSLSESDKKIADNSNEIAATKSKMGDMSITVSNQGNQINEQNNRINSNQEKVTGQINNLNSQIEKTDSKVQNLENSYENAGNKSNSIQSDQASTNRYPSVKAVKDYVDQATQGVALQATVNGKEDKTSKSTDIKNDKNPTTNYPTVEAVKSYVLESALGIDTKIIIDGKENVSNKSRDVSADAGSNDKYPTVAAIKKYVDESTIGKSIMATIEGKEDVKYKTNDITENNANYYPTAKAVKKYVDDATINSLTKEVQKISINEAKTIISLKGGEENSEITLPVVPSAESNVLGIVKLAGDLAGEGTTAAAPIISNSAISSGKLATSAVTTEKIAANAVGFSKIQNVNSKTILGRSTAESGNVEALTLGTGLKIESGVLNSTGGTLTGVTGKDNRIKVVTTDEKAPEVDISENYVGQNSITTVGTITIGTWNGSTVGVANGGTGATTLTGIVKGNGLGALTAVNKIEVTEVNKGESTDNKSTTTALGVSDILYPTQNAVKTYVDNATKNALTAEVQTISINELKTVISLTGGTQTSTITLPVVPSAEATVLGIVKLAGDLAGQGSTADAPVISNLAVNTGKLADNAVETAKIKDAAVSTGKLADNAVITDKLAADAVTSAKILNGTIVNEDILDVTITDAKLATITQAGKVANSATTATAINKASTIVERDANNNFAAGTITANLTGKVNEISVSKETNGFKITGGLTSKTLTVSEDATLSGSNTGDQTITLSGAVTGTGTGSFSTTLSDGVVTSEKINSLAVTTGKLALGAVETAKIAANAVEFSKIQNIDSKTILGRSSVANGNVETLTLGTGLKIEDGVLKSSGGTVTEITGTTNRVSVTNGTSTPSIDISANYVGQSSITTVGTITSGTWSGSTIEVSKGGTGATSLTGYVKGDGTSALTAQTNIPVGDVTNAESVLNKSTSFIESNLTDIKFPSTLSVSKFVEEFVKDNSEEEHDRNDKKYAHKEDDNEYEGKNTFNNDVKILKGKKLKIDFDTTDDDDATNKKYVDGKVRDGFDDYKATDTKFGSIKLTNDLGGTAALPEVVKVGGSTALKVNQAEVAANAATASNTASTIVKRDELGKFNATEITSNLVGNVTGNVFGDVNGNLTGNVNDIALSKETIGFKISGGATSKTLIVSEDATLSGSNTGDQTITLSGAVTGTGTGSFSTTLSDGVVTTSKIATEAVTSEKIANGAIVNADINSDAAIVDTKLAQIATSGKVANSATTATAINTASTIVARDENNNFAAGTITANLAGKVNEISVSKEANGFKISGGDNSKLLTVAADANISGTNTGDQSIDSDGDVTGVNTDGKIKLSLKRVPELLGGTNATTFQGAINNLTSASGKSGQYLRSDGVNASLTSIQAGDLPISLTTNGTSGASTYSSTTGVLNIPNYNLASLGGVAGNSDIAAGTNKTKITYDSKGLITAGADATTADIAESTDKKYVTEAQITKIAGSELSVNKSEATDLGGLGANHEKFPTQKAVKVYIDTKIKANEDRLDDHDDDLRDHKSKLDDQGNRLGIAEGTISSQGDKISLAEGSITSQGNRLTTAEGNIGTFSNTIANQGNRLGIAEGTISSQGDKISLAEGSITSQGNRLGAAEGSITSQGNRLTTAEGNIGTFSNTISNQGGRLVIAEGSITSQGNRLTTAEGNIGTFSNTIANQGNRLGIAEGSITSQGNRLTTAEGNIGTFSNTIANQGNRLGIAEGSITSQGNRLTTAEGNIGTFSNTIANQGNRLGIAEGTISSQGDKISLAEGSITSQGNRLTTAEGNIGILSSTISNQGSRLGSVESEIISNNTRLSTAEGSISSQGVTLTNHDIKLNDHETRILRSENKFGTDISTWEVILQKSNILIGNESNKAQARAISGDITLDVNGVTTLTDVLSSGTASSTWGDETMIPQINLDTKGRIISITEKAVAGNLYQNFNLGQGKIFIGSKDNKATDMEMTGDVTIVKSLGNAEQNGETVIGESKITSSKILDGTIATADLADGVVNSIKIAADAITSAKIANGTIVDEDIATATITDAKLATITAANKVSNSATSATATNTVNAIVARDASGNFAAGTISAALTGNVTGDLTGNASTATSATNLAGGSAGALSYQTVAGTTSFTGVGTAGQVLKSTGGSAPSWTTLSTADLSGTISLTSQVTGVLPSANGGTGVNNNGSTITLGGNLATQGAITTLSGSNTGDQTISLSGAVTGSGTGSFSTTLSNDAVASANIVDGTIATVDLATDAVTSIKIAADAITTDKIAANAVTSAKIVDATIVNADIADATITDAKLATITAANKVSNSATSATVTNTANAIVARDASGNFAAGTISAALTGNVLGDLTGNVTGNVIGDLTGTASKATTLNGGEAGAIAYQSVAGTTSFTGVGTAGQVLKSTGGSAPSWTTLSTADLSGTISLTSQVTGVLPSANGGTGVNNNGSTITLGGNLTTTGDITTLSGSNTGDNAVNSLYSSLVSNATHTGDVTGSTELTIGDGKITSAKIFDGTIAATDLATDAVSSTKIAADAVTSAKIFDGTIVAADLATDAVTSAKILDATIVNADIATNAAIADSKLATITGTGKVANSATTATSELTNSAIVARDAIGNFTANTITATLSGTASKATSLNGGVDGAIAYQSAAGTTAFTGVGTAGQVLKSTGGSAPAWATLSTSDVTGTISLTTQVAGVLPGANGGTGVANSGKTITLGGNLTTSGIITTLSGSNTGDQTIVLQGAVTGSGTGTFTTTLSDNAVTSAKLATDAVTSAKIADATIVNADIANATITDAKLETISTALKVSNSATTATASNTAGAIVARDGSNNFSAGTITASLIGNVTGNLTGTATSATNATNAGNLTGTTIGSVPYQSAPGITSYSDAGSEGDVLIRTADGVTWATQIIESLTVARSGSGSGNNYSYSITFSGTRIAGTKFHLYYKGVLQKSTVVNSWALSTENSKTVLKQIGKDDDWSKDFDGTDEIIVVYYK